MIKSFLKIAPLMGLALFSLYHYTTKLWNDPYPKLYQVEFKVVSGLNKKSKVTALGVNVGRVKKTILDDEKGTVTVVFGVLPDFLISRKGFEIKVVPDNAFGLSRLEVNPGRLKSDADIFRTDEIIPGVNPEPSAFADLVKRRDPSIDNFFRDFTEATRSFKDPESGIGRLLTDEFLAHDVHTAITDAQESTGNAKLGLQALDEGEGSLGRFVATNPGYIDELRDQLRSIRDSLGEVAESLGIANAGGGGLGSLLHDADVVSDFRLTAQTFRETTYTWNNPDSWINSSENYNGIEEGAESLANTARDFNGDDGAFSRYLKDPTAAKTLDENLRDLRNFTGEVRRGENGPGNLITNSDARDILEEVFKRIESITDDAREGIHSTVAGQGVNTIHGAVFSIF